MSNKIIRDQENVSTPVEKDLLRIHGIGRTIETRLNEAEIYTYAQLASMTPEDLAELLADLPGISAESIAQKDWIGQARQLASEYGELSSEIEIISGNSHQHYAMFNVELLLDEENAVRRTRVMHVQSKAESSWAGWENSRLVNFFQENAALKFPQQEGVDSDAMSSPGNSKSKTISAGGYKSSTQVNAVVGDLRLKSQAAMAVKRDQPFSIPLLLNLSPVNMPEIPITYSATVFTKKLGGGSTQTIGKAEGTFIPTEEVIINIPAMPLSRGQYRMEALVTLSASKDKSEPNSELAAMLEGSVFQVF